MQSANLSIETATATDIIPTPSQSILYVLDFDEENPGLSTPYDVITDNNDLYPIFRLSLLCKRKLASLFSSLP